MGSRVRLIVFTEPLVALVAVTTNVATDVLPLLGHYARPYAAQFAVPV